MLQHFNQEMRLHGKIASGHFCASFGLIFEVQKNWIQLSILLMMVGSSNAMQLN
jgi:hypothetical protein